MRDPSDVSGIVGWAYLCLLDLDQQGSDQTAHESTLEWALQVSYTQLATHLHLLLIHPKHLLHIARPDLLTESLQLGS